MSKPEDSPLGKPAAYGDRYDPGLLFSIERAPQRAALGIGDPLPFSGADLWTAYELSWLDPRGKPEVAIGRFSVPAESPRIVESKSLKLYLNSFSQTPFDSAAAVGARDRGRSRRGVRCGSRDRAGGPSGSSRGYG